MNFRLGKTTIVYFLTQVGVTVVGFLATWYITQTLGSAAFGEYSTAVAFLFWLNIPADAIGSAVKKRASEGEDRGAFLAAGHALNLTVHTVLIGALLLFRGQVNVFIGLDIAVPFAMLVGARAVFDLTLGSLRGYKQVGTSGALKTLERTIRSGIHIGALFFLGIGVGGLVLGHGVALILATTAGLVVLNGRPAKPGLRHARSLVEYARYAWLGTLKTRAFGWTDIVVMRGLSLSIIGVAAVSKSQIGIYQVAWTVASALALLSIAINQSLFPELSELGVTEDYDQVQHYINEGLAFTGLFLIPGLFGAIVVGDTLLTVFGPEFATGDTILVILMGARLLAAYGDQLLNSINAIDHPDIAFRVNLCYVATNIGLNLLLVSLFGWYGAATATTLAALTSVVYGGYALTTIIGKPDIPIGEVARQVAASAIMLGIVSFLQALLPGTLRWTFLVVGIGAGVYAIVLFTISERVRHKVLAIAPI